MRTPPRASALYRRRWFLLALLGLLAAAPAHGFEIGVETPHTGEGYVWVDVTVAELFDGRVAESLARGMPATLALRAELWRRRTAWFDRVERTFEGSIRIRYDIAHKSYRVERANAVPRTYETLDSVRTALARSIALPVMRTTDLRDGARYYVAVTATLRPLSVEDVEEVEGWLSGEVKSGRGSSFGFITALPRAVFDAVRNLSGFGDEQARAVSPDFAPGDLVSP